MLPFMYISFLREYIVETMFAIELQGMQERLGTLEGVETMQPHLRQVVVLYDNL